MNKLPTYSLIVKEILHSLEMFEVAQISPDMINDAIEVSLLHKISFWDSLIVVAADLNNGKVIKGVTVVNPFV
ncbi:MAG: PilT protein domain-containing [Ignavibacteria bacterium]|nr:MAG: PilT protein domain-containing [Ignavibacteria bacterium]